MKTIISDGRAYECVDIKLADMSTEHIEACLNTQDRMHPTIERPLRTN
jgi:hypothetical protein